MPDEAHLALDVVGGLAGLSAPWRFGLAKDRQGAQYLPGRGRV